jgi:hypothetical protein
VTLQDVYRAQIEQDKLANEIANLEDSRRPLTAQFKGALGLTRDQPDPPMPARFETTPLDLTGDDLLDTAFARNPESQSDGSGRAHGRGVHRAGPQDPKCPIFPPVCRPRCTAPRFIGRRRA